MELSFFETQLRYFSKNYKAISLKEYWEILNGLRKPVNNAVVLTFDDGYLDNWQYAYPLLKKYGLQGTIFVSPEFVDKRGIVRPNLEDLWKGKANEKDIMQWGFLSWEEMRIMEASGLIDIQSHTMTHTKHFVSDMLVGFHYPGADSLYYIGNKFSKRKPYYISDLQFERLLPFGYPVFESQSAAISRKAEIDPDFVDYCITTLSEYDFQRYSFDDAFMHVKEEYLKRKRENLLIFSVEDDESYIMRLRFEIAESKNIIKKQLNKEVEFLCWPHGDSNNLAHKIAIEAGYLATSLGKSRVKQGIKDRFERLGAPQIRNQQTLSVFKLNFKIKSFQKQQPWHFLNQIYKML